MAARRLPGTAVRVRRGHRRDLPRLRALLGGAAERRQRFDRRALADLGTDVYVAEDAAGEIIGLVAVAYLRSLACGRTAAVLDAACTRSEPDATLLAGLIAFAEAQARRRGCAELRTWAGEDDPTLASVLAQRGYRAASLLVGELESREGL